MTTGTYVLVIDVARETTREIGALGTRTFPAGCYAYVGSAFGSGGFSRIDRHRRLAAGQQDTRHWHVDHLLTADAASIATAHTLERIDAECALANALPGEPVHGFGCTDCGCDAHLFATDRDAVKRAIEWFREDR